MLDVWKEIRQAEYLCCALPVSHEEAFDVRSVKVNTLKEVTRHYGASASTIIRSPDLLLEGINTPKKVIKRNAFRFRNFARAEMLLTYKYENIGVHVDLGEGYSLRPII